MTAEFQQIVANGVASGCIFALVALGFSMSYRAVKFFDLSYAVTLSVSGYATYSVSREWHLSPLFSVAAAMLTAACFALIVHMAVFYHLRRRGAPSLTCVLASLGVLMIGVNALALVFGDAPVMATRTESATWDLLAARLTVPQVATIIATPLVVALAWVASERTKWGRQQRAAYDDEYLAACSGIAIERVVLSGSVFGATLGGLASGLLALQSSTTPFTGFHVLVPALAAAIVGGLGRVTGPAVFGIAFGVAGELFGWRVSMAWHNVLALSVLVVYLLLRPMRHALSPRARVGL
ncbi:branched-chain amino acid ABC transporter permease [bacterium]|nr:branched-chain amino acid ABC transporter permease [bacterium]